MTTTNPVSMSVLPTEQCLIEDGTNIFSVAGQFTPAHVDSYQLCDPNGICLVAGAAGVVATIDELESRAFGLLKGEKYAEAAEAYETLGRAQEERRVSHPAMLCYETAAQVYRRAGNLPKAADAYSSSARMAMKVGLLDPAFDKAGLAVDAYLEAAKTTGTRNNKFEWYKKADALLRTQEELLSTGHNTGRETVIMNLVILEKCAVALEGAVINNPLPTFGDDNDVVARGREAYHAAQAELADVYRRMGDAHIELKQFDKAADAYEQGDRHSNEVSPDMRATRVSSESDIQRERQYHVMALIAKLERDGGGERMENLVRYLEELHHSGQMNVARLLDDQHSWLSEALRTVLREEVLQTSRSRIRGVLKVEVR